MESLVVQLEATADSGCSFDASLRPTGGLTTLVLSPLTNQLDSWLFIALPCTSDLGGLANQLDSRLFGF